MPDARTAHDRRDTVAATEIPAAVSIRPGPATVRPEHTPPRSVRDVAERFAARLVGDPAETSVTGITLTTTDVRIGDLFVAVPGARAHGATYAAAAVAAGATAVLTDPAGADVAAASGVPVVVLPDLRVRLGEIAAWLYGTDAPGLTLYAVTGTNGKTSTVHIMSGILALLGVKSGLSSTAERQIGDRVVVSSLTTPEAPELHALLARMVEEEVVAAALEVSAQAVTRHRVDGLVFDVAGFTNLSHDHLDDYGTMDAYADAKAQLFTSSRSRRAVISLDSEWGSAMVERSEIPTATISSVGPADWTVAVTDESRDGVAFTIRSPGGRQASTAISLLGRHMAADAGLALAMLVSGGMDETDLFDRIEGRVIPVRAPGRIEKVSGDSELAVYVDFAHSPDAFDKTLDAVRAVTSGRTFMVFGADGDRDAMKRPAMSRAAVAGSDVVVITDYNPRTEDPAAIRATLIGAARETAEDQEVVEVGDPKDAIRWAVSHARAGDSILWAGPGHENYRDVGGEHIEYSARDEARAALAESGWV